MVLAKLSDTCWVERLSDEVVSVSFGGVVIRMELADFHAIASVFDPDTGPEMPDESIFSVCDLPQQRYLLSYRCCSLTLCGRALSRFARLCLMGRAALRGIDTGDTSHDEDIERILRRIESMLD
jgi:hypothetical protein